VGVEVAVGVSVGVEVGVSVGVLVGTTHWVWSALETCPIGQAVQED
jgi:ABC-type nitrate/sulfonate/bicarbonate transport system permease component